MSLLVGEPVRPRRTTSASEQPASKIGQEHFLGGIHDLRRLGHEMDAAKKNDISLRRLRLVGKAERIAHVIGHFLDFSHLIVMRQDHGSLLLLQGQDFFLQGTHRSPL